MEDLIVVGSVIKCVDAENSQNYLKLGGKYIVESIQPYIGCDEGSDVIKNLQCYTIRGIPNANFKAKRFVLDVFNDKSESDSNSEKLVLEFRGIGNYNQIIVNEGMAFCTKTNDWVCTNKTDESQRWAYFIRGAWSAFMYLKSVEKPSE